MDDIVLCMQKYEIYLHKNTVNSKVYVGLTRINMLHRWKEHVKKAKYYTKRKKSSYFHQAIVTHGSDVWEHQILEVVDGLEAAQEAETKWIRYYKSNVKEYGYNLNEGGRVAGSTISEETRKKISESVKNLMADPARREASSKKMKEHWLHHPNPFLGKTHTKEVRLKMSQTISAYYAEHNNPFLGKKHAEGTRARMSEAAKKRCADPNWRSPLSYLTPERLREARLKMSFTRKGRHTGRISKEDLLQACQSCTNRKEMGIKLNCTNANICYLIKSFNIREEIDAILNRNKGKSHVL